MSELLLYPDVCVDYLTHEFSECDLALSWRTVIKRRAQLTNSRRLENASWRRWAQRQFHLRQVHPQTINWLKESDVRWLYGPLHISRSSPDSLSSSSPQVTSPASPPCSGILRKPLPKLKPVLKKRFLSEYDSSQPRISNVDVLFSCKSDISLLDIHSLVSSTATSPREERRPKLRFNSEVEQCIVVDASDEQAFGCGMSPTFRDTVGVEPKSKIATIAKLQPASLKSDPPPSIPSPLSARLRLLPRIVAHSAYTCDDGIAAGGNIDYWEFLLTPIDGLCGSIEDIRQWCADFVANVYEVLVWCSLAFLDFTVA